MEYKTGRFLSLASVFCCVVAGILHFSVFAVSNIDVRDILTTIGWTMNGIGLILLVWSIVGLRKNAKQRKVLEAKMMARMGYYDWESSSGKFWPIKTTLEFAEAFEKNRSVSEDKIGDVRVSTVFFVCRSLIRQRRSIALRNNNFWW